MKPIATFRFKSREPFFTKEQFNIKNNTIRKIDLEDERFLQLISFMQQGFNDGDLILELESVETGKVIEKKIRDISVWENLMIITWKEGELKNEKD